MHLAPRDLAGVAIGLALGKASAVGARRLAPGASTRLLAVALVPVALVYPVARRSPGDRAATTREALGVGVMALAAAAAARSSRPELVTAAGWLAHAGFDAVHDAGPGSLLPGWYPAFCAGYDAGVAWDLVLGAFSGGNGAGPTS